MRIVFMGTPEIAVPALERLAAAGHTIAGLFAQPDRPAGRGRALAAPPTRRAAERLGVPVFQPLKVRTEETRDLLASLAPEAVVVFAYGRILPPALLAVPPRGCINVHTSLLPAYRGAAPIQWAIARGETVTGVTTMLMDEGLDTGPMLLRRSTPIGPEETAVELAGRLAALGADLAVETLGRLDDIVPVPQDDAAATFAPVLTRDDGLIDWSLAAKEIVDRCRGFQPWPGTWTTLGGARLHLWRAAVATERADGSGDPGTVLEAGGDRLVVACGEGTRLLARELQLEGRRRMPARDFVNGLRLAAGAHFGTGDRG
jgi:methionyl-tRNA formyltransferase